MRRGEDAQGDPTAAVNLDVVVDLTGTTGPFAYRISAEVRKGRAKALTTGSVADVTVDPGNKRIQVDGANPISIRDGVAMNWVTSDRCPIRGGTRALRFLADGRSCGGVMTLSASGREIELRVDWLTGRVEMSPK